MSERIKQHARRVSDWNEAHGVGVAVRVTKDDGSLLETKTISDAWLLGGHSAVIKVEGIAGGYSLERVEAV